ncbi:MAG: glycosyltransferase [Omnitrophica WOR_2 bacterium]
MSPEVSIIVLTYNNLQYTRQCLESIYARTDAPGFELIVVDNASRDGTPRYLEEFCAQHSNMKVILNLSNEGFARGNNIGAYAASGDVLVFLNNDTVVASGWLAPLARRLANPQVGMVGPVTNASGNETRIEVGYKDIKDMEAFAAEYIRDHAGQSFALQMLPFQCVALRRSVYEEIGPLDEIFGTGMFEDDDYALRLKQKGYLILCAEDSYIHHWGSASFSKLGSNEYWRLFKQNLKKFEDKWGIRWLPQTQRPERVQQQLREALDGRIWMLDALDETQKYVKTLEERVEMLSQVKVELEALRSSNGWIFLQKILAVRRMLIPEGSQRERAFKAGILAIRQLKMERVKDFLQETRILLRRFPAPSRAGRKIGPRSTAIQPLAMDGTVRNVQDVAGSCPERFPWPLVSVILPVYNHADLLEGAARSVLENTYPNLELVILDDGSTDKIEPVLRRLANLSCVRIYRQPNQKLPRALTHAHRFARGEFITWTSSDNLLAPDAIETLANALLAHPEAALVYADVGLIDEKGQIFQDGSYRSQNQSSEQPEVMRLYRDARPLGYEADNYINACFLYRREAAEALEGHFADDLRGLEDYDFWLRLQKAGALYHIRNQEPVYFYRVHKRTMSHDILSQAEEREAHFARIRTLIKYESQRRQYSTGRWSLVLDQSLAPEQSKWIQELATQLPVDIRFTDIGWEVDSKRLRILSEWQDTSDPVFIKDMPGAWRLVWRSSVTGEEKTLDFWKGVEISPLALKARDYRKNIWEFTQAGERLVIGCLLDLVSLPVDFEATRQMIEKNPGIFFVFASSSEETDPVAERLVQGFENAVYLGKRTFGEAYPLYACFDALWLPVLAGELSQHLYRSYLVLAYAIGCPLLAPRSFTFIPAPYQFAYYPPHESLEFVGSFHRSQVNIDLLDSYLHAWTPAGCLAEVLRHADTATQEMPLSRPDFGIVPAEVVKPTLWTPQVSRNDGRLKVCLAVDKMDKGGLEEMVAQLARCFPAHGADAFVLCVKSGGLIAGSLKEQGVRVYIADGDQKQMRRVLQHEEPDLISSHWAHLDLLKVAAELGIPVLDTIHGAYFWHDREGWQLEQLRSRYFTHVIAVSEAVARFYMKGNPSLPGDRISIVHNGVDLERVKPVSRLQARLSLGLKEQDFLFLNVASYDRYKNQIGIMAAFDEISQKYPDAQVYLVGNIANLDYYELVKSCWKSLRSQKKIGLFEYRQDVPLLLSGADVFVLDSFSEGWSLAGTEALMAGLPLIHSECGSAYELVGKLEERGIVVPNPATEPINLNRDVIMQAHLSKEQRNKDALVNAMTRMIVEREEWQAKHDVIRDYALREFSFDNTVKNYIRVFKKVMKSSP